ncbi:MAG: hypothetical protein J5851_00940 [Oscillospiraceae bacterium]|nr:hypothetical protein [Oscillospiraceae bacterium]
MNRNTFLQLAAGLCVLLGAFPLWYWFGTWVGWPWWAAFALTGGSLGLGCVAWLHRRYGFPLERRSLLLAGILARGGAALIGVGVWFAAHSFLTMAGAIVCGVIAAAVYLIAWEVFKFPPEQLLSAYAFILMAAAWFVGILLCKLQGSTPLTIPAFCMFSGTTAAFTAMHSFLRLHKTTEGRDVPGCFYGYNTLLISGFLTVSSALIFGGQALLELLFKVGAALIDYLKKLARYVTALMLQGEVYKLEENQEQESGTVQGGSMWIGYVIEGIVLLAVVILLWRFRREFLDFLRQIVSGAMHALRHLISLKVPEPVPEEHPEYTDNVELIDARPVSLRRARDPLKEARRRYRHAKEPREKYRAGYAVWLLEIKKRGAEFPGSAVPARILEAAGGIPDPALTKHMTELYYRIRYGEYSPSPAELQELQRILKAFR